VAVTAVGAVAVAPVVFAARGAPAGGGPPRQPPPKLPPLASTIIATAPPAFGGVFTVIWIDGYDAGYAVLSIFPTTVLVFTVPSSSVLVSSLTIFGVLVVISW